MTANATQRVDNVLFPAAFITEGRQLDRALYSIGLELPAENPSPGLVTVVLGSILYGFISVGLCAVVVGASDLFASALALVRRLA